MNSIFLREYEKVKKELGHRPYRLDLYQMLPPNTLELVLKDSEDNFFSDYLTFLYQIGDLEEGEKELLNTRAHSFFRMLESTKMTQLYKCAFMEAFYNGGKVLLKVDEERLYGAFKDFYTDPAYAIDLLRNKSTEDYQLFQKADYLKLARNPKEAFFHTHREFFDMEKGFFCLEASLEPYIGQPTFVRHLRDLIDYRARRFYQERLEKIKIYNKLVRDRIPEIIVADGKDCEYETLLDKDLHDQLRRKLEEEVEEFLLEDNLEELADILEVVFALAKSLGYSDEKLMEVKEDKRRKRGGFEKGIILKKVTSK